MGPKKTPLLEKCKNRRKTGGRKNGQPGQQLRLAAPVSFGTNARKRPQKQKIK